jgi:uncharacterized protein YuzE
MRLEYDLDVGALYIVLTDSPIARTREAGDNANVDLDASGDVVGIEVISAAHRWPLAQILDDYAIDRADAAQLRAYFMPGAQVRRMPLETMPVVEARPTAPSNVLVPA